MTIEVEIRNRDATRRIEVVTVDYDKHTRREIKGPARVIEPGLNCIIAVHALRDLIISEQHPDYQMKPKPASPEGET